MHEVTCRKCENLFECGCADESWHLDARGLTGGRGNLCPSCREDYDSDDGARDPNQRGFLDDRVPSEYLRKF